MKKPLLSIFLMLAISVCAKAQTYNTYDNRGERIGQNPTQKVAFFGTAPVVQPVDTADLLVSIESMGIISGSGANPTPLGLHGGTAFVGGLGLAVGSGTSAVLNVLVVTSTASPNSISVVGVPGTVDLVPTASGPTIAYTKLTGTSSSGWSNGLALSGTYH